MPTKPVPQKDLVAAYSASLIFPTQAEAADSLGLSKSTYQHRLYLAAKMMQKGEIETPSLKRQWTYPKMIQINAPSTRWIIGSDLHIWPHEDPLMWRAFVKIAKQLKVDGIILNGDVIDGAKISRHPPLNSKMPKVADEIESAQRLLKQLPRAKHRLWTIGNHDIRIDKFIMSNSAELEGIILTLKDKFPEWEMAYAFNINNTEIRHRFRGGIHAAYNNSFNSGVNTITGHTHQLQVTAVRDRRGTRWGIETGMLNEPDAAQFEYTEGMPSRWQQGFAVVTFDDDGDMYPPEMCEMIKGVPVFRGTPVDL